MKKLNYLIFALIFMIGMSFEVKAAAADDIACITSAGKQQCVLSENLVVTEQLVVQGDVELDLNGYTISVDSNIANVIGSGVIGVLRDAKLTIDDSSQGKTGKITSGTKAYAGVAVTIQGESNTGRDATLIVNGGTIEGNYYGITGNGNRHGTNITINGGTIRGLAEGDNTGIYHPQEGTLVINGGTITGATGIEMRAGTLIVNDGTITGNGELLVAPNGNGSTTIGAGIAVAQHTTLKDINVQIKGGTISGVSAVYESNPQNNANAAEQVSISITDGTFNATGDNVVYSQDLENFVVRGTFNKEVDEAYLSNVAKVEQSGGNYVIAPDNYNAVTSENENVNVEIDTTYESTAYTSPVEMYDVDLSWDDLHWVFVYEGDITNPTNNVWLSKEAYDALNASMSNLSENEVNGAILNDIDNLAAPDLNIDVINHSVFAVNIAGSVEQKTNANYTSSAGLQIALEVPENITYATTANISALATNANANLLVKPTAARFVNDAGVSVNVSGEVKLTFTKAS